jgi:hypothetical protein
MGIAAGLLFYDFYHAFQLPASLIQRQFAAYITVENLLAGMGSGKEKNENRKSEINLKST